MNKDKTNIQNKKTEKQKRKEEKLINKIKALDQKWLQKYGVTYTDAILCDDNEKKKKHHFLYYTRFAFKQIKANKNIFFVLVVLSIIGAIASFFAPVFLEKFLSDAQVGNYDGMITNGIITTLCSLCSTFLGYYLFENLNIKAVRGLGNSLSLTLVKKLLKTKQTKYNQIGSGEIINKSQNSSVWFVERLGIAIGDFAYTVRDFGICVYLACLDIRLLSVLFIGGAISSCISIYCNVRYVKKYDKLHEKVSDKLYNNFGEIVHGSSDVKALNNQEEFSKKIEQYQKYQKNADTKSTNTWLFLEGILSHTIIYILSQILFFILATILLKEQAISLSVIIICIMYKNDVMQLFENTQHIVQKFNRCEVMAERVCDILDEEKYPSETFGNKHLNNFNGNIEFKDVCFSYGNDNNYVLNKTNFTINSGEKVAFVGTSGGGKSTIINLLPKLIEKDSGQILLDGVDIDELDKDSIRNNISLVSQNPYIFNGTIAENLAIANINATKQEMLEALKESHLDEFVNSKPDGIDTYIGEGGITLSGGQKQRLAIARALLRGCKVLLLDEATSALDNRTQEEIKKTVDNLSNKTVIIVAHRLSTIIDCDKIMLLEGGQIVACGKHNELMKNNSKYAKLYNTEAMCSMMEE